MMYKANKGLLPKHVQNSFIKNYEVHKHNTRSKNNFFTQQICTKRRKNSVTQKGIDIWNSLPLLIKESVSLCKFKSAIKIEMLKKY